MSDWLFKELKQDVNRYADISSVLQNVNEKGYLSQLENQFISIFQNEIVFASTKLKQLIDQMKAKGKDVDFNEQFIRNLQIFKVNFDIILKKLSNQIWKQVTTDIYVQRKTNYSRLGILWDCLIQWHRETFKQLHKLVQSHQIILNLHNKSNLILKQTPLAQSSHVLVKNVNKNRQSTLSGSKSPRRDQINMSVSSLKSFNSKNGQPVPFSELSIISGNPSTFAHAKRNLDNSLTTSSPGVGTYKQVEKGMDLIRESSPSVRIAQAPKISWIDERLGKQESHSPGPKYDVSHHYCSKPLKK